jgi:hypothetical protein
MHSMTKEANVTIFQPDDVKAWMMALAAHPHLQGRVPVEAGISFPTLSVDRAGELVLQAFHYMVLRDASGRPSRYATYSRLEMRAADLMLLAFATFDEQVLFAGLPLDAPYTTYANSFGEMRERSKLKADLYALLARLAEKTLRHAAAGDEGVTFLRQYSRLLPPSLMVYYRGLNPAFFDWLRGV